MVAPLESRVTVVTHTHTFYWSADDEAVVQLKDAIRKLKGDYEDRLNYIDTPARLAMERRLFLLDTAASLLLDQAD